MQPGGERFCSGAWLQTTPTPPRDNPNSAGGSCSGYGPFPIGPNRQPLCREGVNPFGSRRLVLRCAAQLYPSNTRDHQDGKAFIDNLCCGFGLVL
jgi:hypothetical protein